MQQSHSYQPDPERMGREQLREWQERNFFRLAGEIRSNGFYEEKLRAAGLTWNDLRSLDDLPRMPLTTKSELVEEQQTHPPFGRLLTYPQSRYRHFHQTSGTTGRPLKWLDTQESWAWWARCWSFVFRGAGVTENDVIFCAFSFGPYISHWAAIAGAWEIGALALSGGGMNSEQRLSAMLDNRCTVLICTPTYALHLAEVAAGQGLDLPSSPIRVSIHAGEPGASVPNVKRRIEESWGNRCFDHAGATEVGAWGFDCLAEDGAIHLNETEFIFEVIDPQSGEAAAEGERGELVITNLGRAGMPVLRYRTGDLVEMTSAPCECGRTLARIQGGVLGRADDMLIVRGVNVYPSAIDNLIRRLPGIVEYEVEIRRLGGMDDLLLKMETSDGQPFEEIERATLHEFRSRLNIRVTVKQAARGSLPRYEFKARRYKRIAE